MNYSKTYLSVIVILLAQILPLLGIDVGSDALTTTVQVIVTVIAGIVVLYKRWTGDNAPVSIFGFKKRI